MSFIKYAVSLHALQARLATFNEGYKYMLITMQNYKE